MRTGFLEGLNEVFRAGHDGRGGGADVHMGVVTRGVLMAEMLEMHAMRCVLAALSCRWMLGRVRVRRAGIWGTKPGETGDISTIIKIEFHGYGSVWGIRGGLTQKNPEHSQTPKVTGCGFAGGNIARDKPFLL